jgi:arsenite methyltransferase
MVSTGKNPPLAIDPGRKIKGSDELDPKSTKGVTDRVELHTGDMTALPFEDNHFDLVVSSLAIHNISERAGREKAISEAVRVLRPGGRLMSADIRATRQHKEQLAGLGMNDVAQEAGMHFWWGGPWAATRLVTATKPVRRNERTEQPPDHP